MIKAIIIDDEMHCRKTLSMLLKEYCPNVQVLEQCEDAQAGLEAIQKFNPDLVFLDIEMPHMNGFEMLELLEQPPAIIFTTAFDEFAIKAFEAHAIDYLLKPFALSELAARIEAVLRRAQGGGRRALQVGDLHYDLDTLEVTREGRLLKLNPVGLKLLAVLMQKSPHVLRREILEEALWGDDCPDSDSLRSHVHQLRQVIDKPFAKPLLQTVHGVGYRLAEGRDGV